MRYSSKISRSGNNDKVIHNKNILSSYQYRAHATLQLPERYDRRDVSIAFKQTPETLLNLAAAVVDALPLPSVYEWTHADVVKWIRSYGYPHYEHTFRENLISGRKLLLLDAAALSSMNIKKFNDIKHIAYGIRSLFHYEMTKFCRSISLPPHYYQELYKLFRINSGPRYEQVPRTDLWRQLQLLRERYSHLSHWDLLERWLVFEPISSESELFGGIQRVRLFKNYNKKLSAASTSLKYKLSEECDCNSSCECQWCEYDMHST